MKFLFCIIFLWVNFALASDVFFNEKPVLWQDGEILIWVLDKEVPIDPREFCLSLKRNNSSIGEPKCRLAGEWERDSIALLYGNWLNKNLDSRLGKEFYKPRHPVVSAKLQNLEDKILLFVAKKEDKLNIVLFDETTLEPRAGGSLLLSPDKISMGDDIASSFFKGKAQRRLSKEERAKRESEPDDFYQDVPFFKGWGGIGLGYAQAHVPLTPKNWTRSREKSLVRNYRITADSLSLWNFLDDSAPELLFYFGGTWFDFIGLEFQYRLARRDMKIDPRDTVYTELDDWEFYQHEVGLTAMFSRNFIPFNWLHITPFAFLGFQYSFFVESISLKDDIKKPSKAYEARIKFESAYKGALIGFGSHFIFFKHYGIGMRTGISSRGRDLYIEPSPDAAKEPTVIGGSTIDWFITGGLEYHFSL